MHDSTSNSVLVAVVAAGSAAILGFGTNRLNTYFENKRNDEGVRTQVRSMLTEIALMIGSTSGIFGVQLTEKERTFIEQFVARAFESDASVAFTGAQLRHLYQATTALRNHLRIEDRVGRVGDDESDVAIKMRRERSWDTLKALLLVMAAIGSEETALQIAARIDSEIEAAAGQYQPPLGPTPPFPAFAEAVQEFLQHPSR
jgi:hypothetical protein